MKNAKNLILAIIVLTVSSGCTVRHSHRASAKAPSVSHSYQLSLWAKDSAQRNSTPRRYPTPAPAPLVVINQTNTIYNNTTTTEPNASNATAPIRRRPFYRRSRFTRNRPQARRQATRSVTVHEHHEHAKPAPARRAASPQRKPSGVARVAVPKASRRRLRKLPRQRSE